MGEKKERNYFILKFMSRYLTKKVLLVFVGIALIGLLAIGIKTTFKTDGKTTKLGFEDIGVLATQAAYCTNVKVFDKSRDLFGIDIPFTQSKYIYSYDTIIKAGIDFQDIQWNIKDNTIHVTLPKAKVISNEINLDSFKVYHEAESIFTQIKLSESNEALKELKQEAQKDAIANGLLENAQNNAKIIIEGFFGKSFDLDKYEIVFSDQE